MADSTPTQSVLFTEIEKRPVLLAFDQAHGSSDGGDIMLSAANLRYNQKTGLIETLAACLPDSRQPGKIENQL